MPEYDAGTGFIQVVPSFRGVAEKITAEAAKWGATSGKAYSSEFNRQVKGGTEVPVGPSPTRTGKDGAQSGGAFGQAFRRQVEAAVRALPHIELDADSTEADRKIASIRAQLAALSGKTVGVDMDSAAALAQVEHLRAALAGLDSADADVAVRVDAASAAAKLAAVQAQVSALDGRDVDVRIDVDDNGSINRGVTGMTGLVAAAVALSPALVPVGGAALAALGGIAPVAAAGALGLGTLALGLAGVSDAVKAVSEAQGTAAKDAQEAARRQAEATAGQASAARQLAGAQASLANARANAADAAEQAAQRVVDAQRDVADAEREAARAVVESARRVRDARTAVAQAQADAAEANVDAARRVADAQRSLVDAQDAADRAAVDGARRVADARRSAADAATDAARRVADAETDLADAQRDTLRAQQDLTDARRDARAALRDLSLAVAGGKLDEEQAVLSLRDALADLRKDQEAGVTGLALQESDLRYRQAAQRLAEVRARNADLRREQEAADKAGVAGAANVVAARERLAGARAAEVDAARNLRDIQVEAARRQAEAQRDVADAVADSARRQADAARRVADAQRSVTDAVRDQQRTQVEGQQRVVRAQQAVTDAVRAHRDTQLDAARRVADAQRSVTDAVSAQARQQRQAAYSISQARSAVVGALAAQEAANRRAAEAAEWMSSEQKKAADALAAIPAAARPFARWLAGLSGQFGALRQAAAAGLFPGLTAGIRAILPLLPSVSRLVGTVADALGDMAAAAGRSLASPFWRRFVGYLAATAGPTLRTMGSILGGLAKGFAGLLMAFQPVAEQMGRGLLRLTDRFAAFGAGAATDSGFGRFLAYLQRTGPKVVETLGSLVGAVGHLLVALAPIGDVVLRGIKAFADAIRAIPTPVLTVLLGAVIAVTAAVVTLNAVQRGLAATQVALRLVSQLMFAAMADGTRKLRLVTIATAAWNAITKIATVTMRVLNLVLRANPIGLVITALTLLAAAVVIAWQRSDTFRRVVTAAWEGIQAAAGWAWEKVLAPTFRFLGDALKAGWGAFLLYARTVGRVWKAVWEAAKWAWERVLRPVFEAIDQALRRAWERFEDFSRTVARVWDKVRDGVSSAWGRIYERIQRALGNIRRLFGNARDAIAGIWSSLVGTVIGAVNRFLTFLNKVIDRVNTFTGRFGLTIPNVKLINTTSGPSSSPTGETAQRGAGNRRGRISEYAQGGPVTGPYIGPTADNVLIRATPREWVMPVAATDYYGPGLFEMLRRRRIPREALPGYARGGLVMPTRGRVSMPYGGYPGHTGIDLAAPTGTPVVSALAGVVSLVRHLTTSYGKHMAVDHGGGLQTLYAHLSSTLASVGRAVRAGEVIGRVGSTGNSTGPHLHFEYRPGGSPVDPAPYLSGARRPDVGEGPGGLAGVVRSGLAAAAGAAMRPLVGALRGVLGADGFRGVLVGMLGQGVAAAVDWIRGRDRAALGEVPTAPGDVAGNVALGRSMAASRGWTGRLWDALYALWQGESGWRHTADNPTSSAYGIPQALTRLHFPDPAQRAAYMRSPATQIRWGLDYIAGAYGDPARAYSAWLGRSPHWYRSGGLFTRPQVIGVAEDGAERLLDARTTVAFERLAASLAVPGAPPPAFADAGLARLAASAEARARGQLPTVSIGQLVAADIDEAVRKVRTSQQDAAAVHNLRAVAAGV